MERLGTLCSDGTPGKGLRHPESQGVAGTFHPTCDAQQARIASASEGQEGQPAEPLLGWQ